MTQIIATIIHTGGAIYALLVFLVGGMIFLTSWLPDEVFPEFFTKLSRRGGVASLVLIGLYIANEFGGIGILRLTALEIILFVIVGLWLQATIYHLLDYANTNGYIPKETGLDENPAARQAFMNNQRSVQKQVPYRNISDDQGFR